MSDGSAPDRHVPVMQSEVLHYLTPVLAPGSVLVDGTLGLGGHSEALLQAAPGITLIAIDRDQQALALAADRLSGCAQQIHYRHCVYDDLGEVCQELGHPRVQGILLDLGVSSLQLDESDRGFAYRIDAPLDMRMDTSVPGTAADLLNSASADELADIFRSYGEERFAGRIARAVIRHRELTPWSTSGPLVELIRGAIPAAARQHGGHPAKRVFQALRIAVNAELEALRRVLPAAIDSLDVGGRLAILSYHSLEDRMVKRAFARGALSSTPPGLPVELPDHAPYLRLLTRGAQQPGEAEIAANPRAASARLRVVERIRSTKMGGAE